MIGSIVLEARGLAVGHRGRVVGRDFDVSLAGGEVLALLGPNGGGKTTLLRTLLGLLPPLAGDLRLDGKPLGRLSARERARLMAYVPQVHAGAFAFTVEEVVLMGRSAHGDLLSRPGARDRAVAAAATERLGIAHLAGRPYTEISGGERQLALIARALAQEPRVVILDEPTASLDFGNQGKVTREMQALAAGGLGVIFSTHDPNHALRHADRALLIRDGVRLAHGPVGEVITRAMLAALYGAAIHEIVGADGRAFLP